MRIILLLSLFLLFACQPSDNQQGANVEPGGVDNNVASGSTEPQAVKVARNYPASKQVDHVDTYHGTDVADPYRWLEDDVRESS